MAKSVGMIIDFKKKDFEIFNNTFEAQEEWRKRIGLVGNHSMQEIDEIINKSTLEMSYLSVPNYYGTVWILYKWNNGTLHHYQEGRYKDIKPLMEQKYGSKDGYKLKKIVLEKYQEVKDIES